MDLLKHIITNPLFLFVWFSTVIASVAILAYDLRVRNRHLGSLMKWVWAFSVAYSGLIGLWVYWFSGRKEIPRDSLWRRSWRSVAHCYSGCGAGEIIGVFIAAGLLGLGNWWIAGITFALAYVAGFALTVGPLMQEGIPFNRALRDALYSETASITVMEITAITLDLWLARKANIGDALFWSSLVASLTVGLFAAYPVNVLLIRFGVKEGMHSPKHDAASA